MSDETESPLLALTAVSSQLVVDAAKAEVRVIGSTDQFERRTYVRAVFAFVEGVNFCQERMATEHEGLSEDARNRAREAVRATQALAQEAGERSRVAQRMRTSFAAFAAAYGLDDPLNPDSPAWDELRACIAIRNRITHPRTGKDCDVSEDDVALVQRVHAWYLKTNGDLVRAASGRENAK